MKDYHDILLMIREPAFLDVDKLSQTINTTFYRRGTNRQLLDKFDETELSNMQTLWNNHLRGLGIFRDRLNFPNQISYVIEEINNWMISNKIEPTKYWSKQLTPLNLTLHLVNVLC